MTSRHARPDHATPRLTLGSAPFLILILTILVATVPGCRKEVAMTESTDAMSPGDDAGPAGTTLDTIIVFTTQMDVLAEFYAAGLDISSIPLVHDGHRGTALGSIYFGFDAVDLVEGAPPGGTRLWFTVDDLNATFARFVSMGAPVVSPPTHKPWGATLAVVKDPDGNWVGLSQR